MRKKISPTEATLVFLVEDGHVWMAVKTKKIGVGRRNGYGGKVEPDETREACAKRELQEEAKVIIDVADLCKMAELNFKNTDAHGKTTAFLIHVYVVKKWEGIPQETETMADPKRFPISDLPFARMMPADPSWMPLPLAGQKVKVETWYGPDQQTLLSPVSVFHVDSF